MKSLLYLFLSFPLFADQECKFDLTLQNATTTVEEVEQMVQQELIIKRPNNSSNCSNYRVFFSKGLANSYQRKAFSVGQFGTKSINYNLYKNINQVGILKELVDALNSNEYLDGRASDTTSAPFYISVPGFDIQSTPVAGVYNDNVQVALYSHSGNGNLSFEEVRTFTVSLIVSKKVNLSLVDEGQPFDASSTTKVLDFGLIEKGQIKGADLRVVSNTPYQVRVSSQNGGALKLGTSAINYQMRVNSSNVSIGSSSGSGVVIGQGNYPTNSAGDVYNLKFEVLTDTTNLIGGLYQDVITVTAIAN